MRVAIVGGGAAGFLSSIVIKKMAPLLDVTIYEANSKPLAKVGITGGGRCNITNTFKQINNVATAYPRGEQIIKRAFKIFSPSDTYRFFENIGIKLTIQEDETVFPQSQSAKEVVNKLISTANKLGVNIVCNHKLLEINNISSSIEDNTTPSCLYQLKFSNNQLRDSEIVVITTGGAPKIDRLDFLKKLDFHIVPPTPSLFSLKLKSERDAAISLQDLQGLVIKEVTLQIPKTTFKTTDTLLITHWGISGPATLRLSSYASRYLYENNYRSKLSIKWLDSNIVNDFISKHYSQTKKQIKNTPPEKIPSRLWDLLIKKSSLREDVTWEEIGTKGINKLTEILTNDLYEIVGKDEYKEEFVTCGGIASSNINLNSLESKIYPNLYFAGEVLDIDAITGGFNLQAAWSTAYVVAQSIIKKTT